MKRALILSGIYWNEPLQRHQQFAKYLSDNGYEVVFVERIMSSRFSVSKLIDVLKRKMTKAAEYSENKNDIPKYVKVVNYGFVNPEGFLFKWINETKIRRLISENGTKYDLVINYLPINTTRILICKVNYRLLIYDCVRNFSGWNGYRADIVEEEKWLIEKSDKIFTDSYYLTDKMKGNKELVQFLPIASENWLKGCKGKKVNIIKNIAYFGSIESHIDTSIFEVLSKYGYVVHIWGVHADNLNFPCEDHGYLSDAEELASQITGIADAIILPYRGNMDGVIPAKMFQCLSSGLPVFISSFYDSDKMKDYLYVFNELNELVDKLDCFKAEEFEEKKKKIAVLINKENEKEQFRRFIDSIQSRKV